MTEGEKPDATESLIETLHATRRLKSLVTNPDYLDDEKLPEDERAAVLREIFNRKIREKQISRTTTLSGGRLFCLAICADDISVSIPGGTASGVSYGIRCDI